MGRLTVLAVLLLAWTDAMAWDGGPDWMRHQPTAEEKCATATLRAWQERGLAAAPEMLEAVCARTPLLDHGAQE